VTDLLLLLLLFHFIFMENLWTIYLHIRCILKYEVPSTKLWLVLQGCW